MTGWADGVDPRISEILNTANVEEDGSWNVIFDKGWRSYTSPLSTKNMKFEPADYLGGESYLVVGSSQAQFSRNGTHLGLGNYLYFAFNKTTVPKVEFTRFMVHVKVRVIKGLYYWLSLRDYDSASHQY